MPVMKKMCLEFSMDNADYPRECKLSLTVSGKDYGGMKKTHVLTTKYSDIDTILDKALDEIYLALDKWDHDLVEEDWKERNKGAGTPHLDVPVPKQYHERNFYLRKEEAERIAKYRAEEEAKKKAITVAS
jgi:hypothetical protein